MKIKFLKNQQTDIDPITKKPCRPIFKGEEFVTISEVLDGVKWYIFITMDGKENFIKESELKGVAVILEED